MRQPTPRSNLPGFGIANPPHLFAFGTGTLPSTKLSLAPRDQPPLLLRVRDLELHNRLRDCRRLDVAEELPALADQRDLPAMNLPGGWFLRGHASSLPHQTDRGCSIRWPLGAHAAHENVIVNGRIRARCSCGSYETMRLKRPQGGLPKQPRSWRNVLSMPIGPDLDP